MMFGKVAPAPLSFTCAAAGAARAARAASASREDFVMVRASSELEIDLRLEQGLRACREVGRVQGGGLVVRVVPVTQEPPVGRELIGQAPDEARLLVHGTGLPVPDVDAPDDPDLGLRDLVDAECAVDVPVERAQLAVLRDRGLARERDLLGPIGNHPDEAVPVSSGSPTV